MSRGEGRGGRFQVPPKSAKGRISLGLRRIRPKPCGGFGCQSGAIEKLTVIS
jgi:hypothetical protein